MSRSSGRHQKVHVTNWTPDGRPETAGNLGADSEQSLGTPEEVCSVLNSPEDDISEVQSQLGGGCGMNVIVSVTAGH